MTAPLETAMGTLRVEPEKAVLMGRVLRRVEEGAPGGEPIFAFPMLSLYYGLSAHRNPTPYDVLAHHTYRTLLPDAEAEEHLAETILAAGTRLILFDEPPTMLNAPRLPEQRATRYAEHLLGELTRAFELWDVIGTTVLLRRREGDASRRPEPGS